MKRTILYAWELGEGLGHIAPFMPVAAELERRGYEVVFALRDLASVRGLFLRRGGRVLQAPWLDTSAGVPESQILFSHADIMLRCGWFEAAPLAALLGAWRALIEMTGAGLIVADHAPAALAAVHAMPEHARPRRLTLSTGFFVPPALTPLPTYLPWMNPPASALAASDAQALAALNGALQLLKAPPLPSLADVFRVERSLFTTYEELEHYHRSGPDLIGTIVSQGQGVAPEWPPGAGPRIFAYLQAKHVQFGNLMAALRGLGWPALIYAPGAHPDLPRQAGAPHLRFSAVPLDMRRVAAECDIGVNHAGHGTVCDLLLAGKPVLTLPDLVERGIVARHVEAHGLGLLVRPDTGTPAAIGAALRRLATEPALREPAAAFGRRHGGVAQQDLVRQVAEVCEALYVRP